LRSEGSTVRRQSCLFVQFAAIIAILLVLTTWSTGHAAETLTILHLNDFHGRLFPYLDKAISPDKPVGGAAYVAAMINAERIKNPKRNILLSAGDMFQGTPDSNLFQGRPVLEFMNAIRFDAMTLGNHEFDWGRAVLDSIIADARFPVLCANIGKPDGGSMAGTRPYVMLKRKGIRIAVIGLMTPEICHMVNAKFMKDLKIQEPEEVLPGLIREVKGKGADLVVLLTHLGFDSDRRIASSVEGIDIIIGGHSHTAVTRTVTAGRTVIAQAGYNGTHLGVLDLSFDRKTGKVRTAAGQPELRVVSATPADRFDEEVARIADAYHQKIKDRFQETIGETTVDLRRRFDGESNIGNLITDAMRQAAQAEVGVCNNGGIRADILKGNIRMEQIYTVLPFDNVLVAMDLKGEDIVAFLEESSIPGKGMLQVSGIRVTYDLKKAEGSRVTEVSINGAPLDPERTYRVATNDFLANGGDRFAGFRKGTNVVSAGELRDVIVGHVRKTSPLSPAVDGRIRLAE
jgi:2',3'-cyclic-nucleotide 2'-phosphodiesterase (5'-nucleotidase family)